MSDPSIHPRIAERALANLSRRIEVERTTAIAALERAVTGLSALGQKPGCRIAPDLTREYETALRQLKSLDPTRPPSAGSVLEIGGRLEAASRRLGQGIRDGPACASIPAPADTREMGSARRDGLRAARGSPMRNFHPRECVRGAEDQ